MEKVVRITRGKDAGKPDADLRYWLSRPVAERIAAVELLRREFNGGCDVEPRLQRVYRVTQLRRG